MAFLGCDCGVHIVGILEHRNFRERRCHILDGVSNRAISTDWYEQVRALAQI